MKQILFDTLKQFFLLQNMSKNKKVAILSVIFKSPCLKLFEKQIIYVSITILSI